MKFTLRKTAGLNQVSFTSPGKHSVNRSAHSSNWTGDTVHWSIFSFLARAESHRYFNQARQISFVSASETVAGFLSALTPDIARFTKTWSLSSCRMRKILLWRSLSFLSTRDSVEHLKQRNTNTLYQTVKKKSSSRMFHDHVTKFSRQHKYCYAQFLSQQPLIWTLFDALRILPLTIPRI